MRRSLLVRGACLGLSLVAGCFGSSEPGGPEAPAEDAPTAALVEATWPVALAAESDLAPYIQAKGWATLVMKRRIPDAVPELAEVGGLAAARAHADAAATFRQAALLTGESLLQTYGETPQPTDPLAVAHLLTVSHALRGEVDEARAASARYLSVTGDDDPARPWHGPWASWLEAGATWPPDLSGLPFTLPPVAAGEWPEVPPAPHYSLPEQGVDTTRDMGDPGALLALALWHEQAARDAAGAAAGAVALYGLRTRLPAEPFPEATSLPTELLFGSDYATPDDASYLLSALSSGGTGTAADFADRSALAWVVERSRDDDGLDPERTMAAVSALREAIVSAAAARAGGEQAFHRTFADVVATGLYRDAALVAEAAGDREASGVLRITAFEGSDGATACPAGLLTLAAWDAGNRYPVRALDIVHGQSRDMSALQIARHGLDVLALRVGRETTGQNPGM